MSELTTVGLPNGETKHTDRSGLEIQLAEKADGLITLPKLESIESNLTLSGKIREYDCIHPSSPNFANWTQGPAGFPDEDLRQYHYRHFVSPGSIATTH